MKFNLCSFWLDPAFYLAAGVFALALLLLVFSIRKYLEIKNKSDFEELSGEAAEVQDELPLASAEAVKPAHDEAPAPVAAVAEPASHPDNPSKAEEFVKGLYQNMASLDARLKNIEAIFSKAKVNRDFTVTFLEDMVADFDALDKEKIKARIEYLVEDLKKG